MSVLSVLEALAGFFGAWLLVAGPVFQASLELEEQGKQVDRDAFHSATNAVPRPPRSSPFWWLLPPVAYLKQRKASTRYRAAVMDVLSHDQIGQFIAFTDKATGWLLVGTGGLLLALRETVDALEALRLPLWAFWPVAAVAFTLCVLYTVLHQRRSHGVLAQKRVGATAR